jgi:hypothetical protein
VVSSLWCSMMRILVTGKPDSQLSLEPGLCYLGDHAGGVRDLSDARQHDLR